jgi:dihydroorotase
MVHFSHVTLAEEAELIARAQSRGLPVSGEATPHHLWLSDGDSPMDDPNFRMSPPLRPAKDVAALRRALARGIISVIASDHAPHAPSEKAADCDEAPPGVIGLETTLGVVWTALVHADRLDAGRAVRAMTSAPAAVLNAEPPFLQAGARGDVTVFDPNREWVVDPDAFQSKSRNCPFAGRELRGKPVATVVEGRVAMRDGAITISGAAE